MARLRFTPGIRFRCAGQTFLVRQMVADQRLLVENQTLGELRVMQRDELVPAWAAGNLDFEVLGPNTRRTAETSIATAFTIADFQQLPAAVRDGAWQRYQVLLPLLRRSARERTRAFLDAYVASLQTMAAHDQIGAPGEGHANVACSRATLERWLRAFHLSGYDVRSLVPGMARRGAKGTPRLDAATNHLVQSVLDECRATPAYRTGTDVYLLVVNRIAEYNRQHGADAQLDLPSRSTIERHINAAGRAALLRGHTRRARAQERRAVFGGPQPSHILERVEIDHTLLHLFLVDADDRLPIGRPTLTTALDVYSGYPLGCYVGFEPPTYRAVMNCLLHSIVPKVNTREQVGTQQPWLAYGIPETLAVDNGPEFVGRDLHDACGQPGITLEPMPVCRPWFKGSSERYFRTTNTGLIHFNTTPLAEHG